MTTQRHFLYVVECADGTLYTGYATDVARRVESRITRARGRSTRALAFPCVFSSSASFPPSTTPERRVPVAKRLTRARKLSIIDEGDDVFFDVPGV